MRDVYADTPGSERYAGFWIRVFANVLDVLLLAAVNMVVTGPAVFTLLFPPIVIIGSWIAFGASPGKMMCRLRIVDEPTGGRPTAWQCVGRYAMGLVVLALLGIGYVYLVMDPRKQGWHDKLVRTLVVRCRPAQ